VAYTLTMVTPRMYPKAKTWNPFKGCQFDCTYCVPTFKRQAKRQKHNCAKCYAYLPHYHEERLTKIPATDIVFVCGNADISFCNPAFTRRIIDRIKQHIERCPGKTYYFQSKQPAYFAQFLSEFPENVILLTTLETNRDESVVSKAPVPSERYRQFKSLDYPRKAVTIEPIMDFDLEIFADWIRQLRVEYVWLGYNSHPGSVALPEPSSEKFQEFWGMLVRDGIEVRGKELR
jgi:uncharacterized Fe-S cluster-containing radical SAM superfamily protein